MTTLCEPCTPAPAAIASDSELFSVIALKVRASVARILADSEQSVVDRRARREGVRGTGPGTPHRGPRKKTF
jgi:hypothetical protein